MTALRCPRVDRFTRVFEALWAAVVVHHACEDAAADAFEAAWHHLDTIPPGGELDWLTTLVGQPGQHEDQATFDLDDRACLHDHHGVTELSVDLDTAAARLTPSDRKVLLTAAHEHTTARAAAAVGCSPATYSVRLHRARQRLRAALHHTPATAPLAAP